MGRFVKRTIFAKHDYLRVLTVHGAKPTLARAEVFPDILDPIFEKEPSFWRAGGR